MKKAFLHLLIAVFFLAAISSSVSAEDEVEPAQKAVLITGASTGLGRVMAELLASKGHFVYAGARKEADIAELSAIENIQGIRLDVTVQSDIDAAVKTITEAGRGLYGLVNNAGVAVLYPLIEIDEEEFNFQMDVNLYGPYRVTKAFAPLIIESKGRITTTGSISGILSGPLFGPYSMTKHAMEAFTDSLAREMARFDVKVSIIEPGNYDSKIGDNIARRMEARNFSSEGSLYQEDLERMQGYLNDGRTEGNPIEVAEAAEHALFDANPKRRYLVVPNQEEAGWTINKAIEELAQLNQGQKYSYSREELIQMLDAALTANP
jgi:NAD(P)-dependent dehydrogenase (short-subunit alcohol dehydrogenase family)